MAQIAPFAGIHYDPAGVVLADVIAPPYDVLSPAQQDELYARDPYNIVRLILNKETPQDDSANNRYTRAAAFLQDCLRKGILVQDETPALYEYIQRFAHPLDPQKTVERRTLFVALKLEPYENGIVLPHEETHPKAKADRLHLMRTTRANPEPIYGLYEDPQQAVAATLTRAAERQKPLIEAVYSGPGAPASEQHILYRHTDPDLLAELAAFFAPRRVWIADGHHRYETALNYREEREKGRRGEGEKKTLLSDQPLPLNTTQDVSGRSNTGIPVSPSPLLPFSPSAVPEDFILIGLSAFEDPGLVVLPTHRLVKNLPAGRMSDLPLQLERYFHLQILPVDEARKWIKEERPGQKCIVLLVADRGYALTLRDESLADVALDDSHCEAWRHLDVTILQALVLDRSLGISWQALAHTPDVAYTRDEEEAVQKVQSGEYQMACLLQNPSVTEVRDVAAAGDKMPQKSTFFYPKLYSGLIIRSLE